MSKQLNSFIGQAMRQVQVQEDEYVKDCFRAATRWLNQAKAAEAQDDLGHLDHCRRKATWWVREASRYVKAGR